MIVCSNFILHLGAKEQKQLRHIAIGGVTVEESFDQGQARITVLGNWPEDVAVVALQVEAMLCDAVDEFVRQEERQLPVLDRGLNFKRTEINHLDPDYPDVVEARRQMGLTTVKVDRTF